MTNYLEEYKIADMRYGIDKTLIGKPARTVYRVWRGGGAIHSHLVDLATARACVMADAKEMLMERLATAVANVAEYHTALMSLGENVLAWRVQYNADRAKKSRRR